MRYNLTNRSLASFYGYFENHASTIRQHIQIPVDNSVQLKLHVMLSSTLEKLQKSTSLARLPIFSPAEKYSAEESSQIALTADYLTELEQITRLTNLPTNANALNNISDLEFYYVRFQDTAGNIAYGFRRASQFKGVLKSSLLTLRNNSLHIIPDNVFKLDNDFDYIVADGTVYILRPSGFEFTTNVHQQVLNSAASNAIAISAEINFIEMATISRYAQSHSRSARLLSAIRARTDLALTDKSLLLANCIASGITYTESAGKISPSAGHEYEFLCILDRRLYIASLVENVIEKYEASSRIKK